MALVKDRKTIATATQVTEERGGERLEGGKPLHEVKEVFQECHGRSLCASTETMCWKWGRVEKTAEALIGGYEIFFILQKIIIASEKLGIMEIDYSSVMRK